MRKLMVVGAFEHITLKCQNMHKHKHNERISGLLEDMYTNTT